MRTELRRQLGQNTAEYLIMLTLVAVGSIGLMTIFGQQIRTKITMVTAAFQGQDAEYRSARDQVAGAATRSASISSANFGIAGSKAADAQKEFSDATENNRGSGGSN